MPASCPFCGTTLNFGLKFCVVCGRHTTSSEMTKMGGLKSGIKQAESTRRLDDSISSSDFETSRKKPVGLARHIRSLGEHLFYVLIGVTLFFCAIRYTLQNYFPGRVHQLLAPILGKNSSDVVEQTLTGTPTAPTSDEDASEADKPVKKDDAKKLQVKKPIVATTKKTTRTRKHGRHRSHHHVQQQQKQH